MIKELQWNAIAGYENMYEISDYGNVKSLNRIIELPNGKTRTVKGRTLKPKKNQDGYYFVTLSKNGAKQSKYLQRLVADAFIPNPNNLPQVNHLQGKDNNTPETLEWVSASSNTLHAYKSGLNSNMGGNHTFAKGVIDNDLGLKFDTILDWTIARGLNYSTGRNILSGCNNSKTINLSQIVKLEKEKTIKNEY